MKKKYQNIVGLISLIIIASSLIFIFYAPIIKSPNYVFFSTGGDGFKSTFGSYYHYKFDSTYMHTYSMNYPYGESVFYTGNQPFAVNTLKFISKASFDFSDSILGILNIWMIFTILLGIVFMYLLLTDLGLPIPYSAITAIIIIFLSPQIFRFSGHYNLGYLVIMPLILYLLNRYYKKPNYLHVFITSIIAFIAMYVHGYYYAFYAIWVFFMHVYLYFKERKKFPLTKVVIHTTILIILPFLLFKLVTNDTVTDRTVYPWGAIHAAAYLESVFLPINMPYGKFLNVKNRTAFYIGIVATISFITLLFRFTSSFKNPSRREGIFFSNKFLNSILIGSLIALIFSFTWPFRFSFGWPHEWNFNFLLNYAGPLRQFRGTGRFSWLFYYVMNIVAFYYLWQWFRLRKTGLVKAIIIITVSIAGIEAYFNMKCTKEFNNHIPELEDTDNQLPQNLWISQIDICRFQSILPLPYYHVGSESFWIVGGNKIEHASFIASWKTGLPLMSVMLSRTSLSQTMKSIELVTEPLQAYRILGDFPNKKDILIMEEKKKVTSPNELRLLEKAIFITGNDHFAFHRLPIDSLMLIPKDFKDSLLLEINQQQTDSALSTLISSNNQPYIYKSFGNINPEPMRNDNTLKVKARKTSTILDTVLFDNVDTLIISLWISGMKEDLLPRTRLEFRSYNGDQRTRRYDFEIFREIKTIDSNGWGLYEVSYVPKNNKERLVLSIWNKFTTNQRISFDDILIRPKKTNISYKEKKFSYLNNRYIENDTTTQVINTLP